MKTDVKSAMADIIKNEEIEYIFGYTGGHIMHLWEAVNQAGLKLILNKQEGNAVYMADGFARITKKPSVILATAGPGSTNMTTGLATAYLDSIPLIAIGANVSTSSFGRNALQDSSGRGRAIEQRLVFKAVCKQAMLAPSPQAVPLMVQEAFRTAVSGRPGPVYIEIPVDFWKEKIDYQRIKPDRYKNSNLPDCPSKDSQKIYQRLFKAQKPLVIIGEGALEPDIQKALKKFLNNTGVPFGVSPMGKNAIDEYDYLYLGVARSIGKTQKIYEYMKQSDFILFLGDRMQEWETDWYNQSLIKKAVLAQVESDYQEIGRVFPVNLSVVGSIASFLIQAPEKSHPKADKLKKLVRTLRQKYPRIKRIPDKDGISPLNLNNIVEERASKDASIVCDTGYAKSMAILKYRTRLNQSFITADKNGPMGYSVPAALGVALATGKETICFVGDGGFQMTLNELGTAMNYNLKVIYIIENNGGCASIVNFHTKTYGHYCAADFKNPDYADLAKSYEMEGFRVETSQEFERAFLKAQKSQKSAIIDAKLNQKLMIWE
ncbi:MAG: thiamine pyrophosphate-binding protein [Candidatus Pacebacteria bacterium]|nr:thiamine pyrophosphate-binding protein [Candidatus Paceibacterota bacterium]